MQNARQRPDAEQVLEVLRNYCQELKPGDLVPPHQQLMRRFDASERSVRWALDELRRQGRIVRRRGARTVVADLSENLNSNGAHDLSAAQPTENQTRTIVAIAIPDYALFDQAMELLVQQAKTDDISVLCHLLHRNDVEAELPQITRKPLGFIVFRRELLPLAEKLHAAGHKVVSLATPYVGVTPAVPVVYGDHEYGGYLATKHLIELGHRRIAFCAYDDVQQTMRWQGHQRALREATKRGLEVQESFLDLHEIETWKDNPASGEAILRSSDAPTGLVLWNDHEAVMVMGQLSRLGLRVPQDVSIVGYDNLREGQLLHPALTSVHSSMEQQLQAAINLLTRDSMPSVPYQLVVQPTLICRDSSLRPQ